MINLNKKVIDIEINGGQYKASLDVATIVHYKQHTNKNFLHSIAQLGENEDLLLVIELLGSVIKDTKGKPVGIKFFMEYNPVEVMMQFLPILTEVINGNFPEPKNEAEKK